MECANCERALVKGDKFCPGCGASNPGYVEPPSPAPKKEKVTNHVTREEFEELKKKIERRKPETEVL